MPLIYAPDADPSQPPSERSSSPLFEAFSKIRMNYGPNDRQSTNVEDRRGEPPMADEQFNAMSSLMPSSDAEAADLRDEINVAKRRNPNALKRSAELKEWLARADQALQAWDRQGTPKQSRRAVEREFNRVPPLMLDYSHGRESTNIEDRRLNDAMTSVDARGGQSAPIRINNERSYEIARQQLQSMEQMMRGGKLPSHMRRQYEEWISDYRKQIERWERPYSREQLNRSLESVPSLQ